MRARITFDVDLERFEDTLALEWELENGYVAALDEHVTSIENVSVVIVPQEGDIG